ncbi:hypothetical protein [Flavobacterium notoginsengisoli]|uniref:hypothetical protein n=1 Tax=Flavobacterium notoginsengisoli TaxID=1478199 RepID=UPI00362EF97D
MLEIIREIFKDFLPVGVFLTFLISLTNIIVTTKNLKKTKFIDTITSERIKCLETIRNEGSEIISELSGFLNYLQLEVEEIKNEDPSENRRVEITFEYQQNFFNAKTSNILSKNRIWTRTEFIKNLNLFKLRLNYKEDIEIITLINGFIKLVKNEYNSEKDITEANENLETFINKLKVILKNEWEKVKKETK